MTSPYRPEVVKMELWMSQSVPTSTSLSKGKFLVIQYNRSDKRTTIVFGRYDSLYLYWSNNTLHILYFY